ncbi:MAG: hypothetical protein IKO61_12565 [Lachnospiraceae bacterium]|nr:hypothetical protein [Lachnospiraceae bacterium]
MDENRLSRTRVKKQHQIKHENREIHEQRRNFDNAQPKETRAKKKTEVKARDNKAKKVSDKFEVIDTEYVREFNKVQAKRAYKIKKKHEFESEAKWNTYESIIKQKFENSPWVYVSDADVKELEKEKKEAAIEKGFEYVTKEDAHEIKKGMLEEDEEQKQRKKREIEENYALSEDEKVKKTRDYNAEPDYKITEIKPDERIEKVINKNKYKKIKRKFGDRFYVGLDKKYAVQQKDDSARMARIRDRLIEYHDILKKENEYKGNAAREFEFKALVQEALCNINNACDQYLSKRYRKVPGEFIKMLALPLVGEAKFIKFCTRWHEVRMLKKEVAKEHVKRFGVKLGENINILGKDRKKKELIYTDNDEVWSPVYSGFWKNAGVGVLAALRFLVENPIRLALKVATVPVWAVNEGIRKIVKWTGHKPQRHIKFPGLYWYKDYATRILRWGHGKSNYDGQGNKWYDMFFVDYHTKDKDIIERAMIDMDMTKNFYGIEDVPDVWESFKNQAKPEKFPEKDIEELRRRNKEMDEDYEKVTGIDAYFSKEREKIENKKKLDDFKSNLQDEAVAADKRKKDRLKKDAEEFKLEKKKQEEQKLGDIFEKSTEVQKDIKAQKDSFEARKKKKLEEQKKKREDKEKRQKEYKKQLLLIQEQRRLKAEQELLNRKNKKNNIKADSKPLESIIEENEEELEAKPEEEKFDTIKSRVDSIYKEEKKNDNVINIVETRVQEEKKDNIIVEEKKEIDEDYLARKRKERAERPKHLNKFKQPKPDMFWLEDLGWVSPGDYKDEKEKGAEEEVIRKAGLKIPKTHAEIITFRNAHSEYYDKEDGTQGCRWIYNEEVTKSVGEAFDYLAVYYTMRNKSLDKKTGTTARLPMPKIKFSLGSKIADRGEGQGAMNCYCCSGTLSFNTFLQNEKKAGNIPEDTYEPDQYDMRAYTPDQWKSYKEYERFVFYKTGANDEATKALLVGDIKNEYRRYYNETSAFCGETKSAVGNIFEIGDFFLEQKEDVAIHKMVFTIPGQNHKKITKNGMEYMVKFTKEEKAKADAIYHNLKATMINKVYEVLKTGNTVSMVGLIPGEGKHYLTIYGIDGENFIYADSLYPKEERKGSIEKVFMNRSGTGQPIEINWFSNIGDVNELTNEYLGLKHDNERGFYVDEEEQTLADYNYLAQTKGVSVGKMPDIENVNESIYLPKLYGTGRKTTRLNPINRKRPRRNNPFAKDINTATMSKDSTVKNDTTTASTQRSTAKNNTATASTQRTTVKNNTTTAPTQRATVKNNTTTAPTEHTTAKKETTTTAKRTANISNTTIAANNTTTTKAPRAYTKAFLKKNASVLKQIEKAEKEFKKSHKKQLATLEKEDKKLLAELNDPLLKQFPKRLQSVQEKIRFKHCELAEALDLFDYDYKEKKYDGRTFTEKRKKRYEDILLNLGFKIGDDEATNDECRKLLKNFDEVGQEYYWKVGVPEEVKEAYDWLGQYYNAKNKKK